MAKDNESPDSGYSHFHPHGMKKPASLAKGLPDKRAANSGDHQMGAPKGRMPPMPILPGEGPPE